MKKCWWIFFLIYFFLIILGTLAIQGRSPLEWVHVLIPPGKLREFLVYPLQHHHPVTFAKLFNLADTILNILLFFPLGIGIFLVFNHSFSDSVRKILIMALLVGLLLSICIEIFQYLVPKRIPSLSDIIANTGGAVFGCYILCFRKMYRKIKTTEQKRTTTSNG